MTGTMAKVKAFSAVTDSEMKVFEFVFEFVIFISLFWCHLNTRFIYLVIFLFVFWG